MNLPDGFRQLEYLESSGTQIINSGWTPFAELHENIESGLRIDGLILDQNNYKICVGFVSGDGKFGFVGPSKNASAITFRFCTQGFAYSTNDTSRINSRFIYELNYKNSRKSVFKDIVGEIKYDLNSVNNSSCISGHPLRLFGMNTNIYGGESPVASKLWSVEFTEGNKTISRFVPALREDIGQPGMYDVIKKCLGQILEVGILLILEKKRNPLHIVLEIAYMVK